MYNLTFKSTEKYKRRIKAITNQTLLLMSRLNGHTGTCKTTAINSQCDIVRQIDITDYLWSWHIISVMSNCKTRYNHVTLFYTSVLPGSSAGNKHAVIVRYSQLSSLKRIMGEITKYISGNCTCKELNTYVC